MLFPGHKGSVIVNKTFSANILSQPLKWTIQCCRNTVCPRSSDLFYIVSYYTEWVTTSWPSSIRGVFYPNTFRANHYYSAQLVLLSAVFTIKVVFAVYHRIKWLWLVEEIW